MKMTARTSQRVVHAEVTADREDPNAMATATVNKKQDSN